MPPLYYQPLRTRFGWLRPGGLEVLGIAYAGVNLRLDAVLHLELERPQACRLEFSDVRAYRVHTLEDFVGDFETCLDELVGSSWCMDEFKHFQVIARAHAIEVLARQVRFHVSSSP
jgi:hypothetical protein